jgi:hypothetical protein
MGSAGITAWLQFYSVRARAEAATGRSPADADKVAIGPAAGRLAARMHGMPDETLDDTDRDLDASDRLAAAGPAGRGPVDGEVEGDLLADDDLEDDELDGGTTVRRLPRPPRWLRPTAGWTAGAVLVGGLAWLLMALITDWTSYPLLNVTSWRTLTYGQRSAQVSFVVHNGGNAEASHCVAYVRLGRHRLFKRPSPPVPAHGTGTFFLTYRDPGTNTADVGYAWAACDGAVAARQEIPTVRMVDLVTSHAQILTARAATTVRFQVSNLGSRPAVGCHAYLRLSTGKTIGGYVLEPPVRGQATATFSVRYEPPIQPGRPVAAWAECTLASPGRGNVSSSRVYLAALQPSQPRQQ